MSLNNSPHSLTHGAYTSVRVYIFYLPGKNARHHRSRDLGRHKYFEEVHTSIGKNTSKQIKEGLPLDIARVNYRRTTTDVNVLEH